VSIDNKFVCGIIQKNASTSILATLNKLYYNNAILGTPYQMMDAIPKNDKICQLSRFNDDEIVSILDDPHFYKFTTLRDPYQRFVSAYMTKLPNMPKFVETYGISDDMITNLDNAIEFISQTPDEERDIHFKSQYQLGNFEVIKYKRVLHTRNLYHNWNLLKRDKPNIPKLGEVRNQTNSNEMIHIINNYHPNAKRNIMNIYQVDYDIFTSFGLIV
jgi:hypothetical protein